MATLTAKPPRLMCDRMELDAACALLGVPPFATSSALSSSTTSSQSTGVVTEDCEQEHPNNETSDSFLTVTGDTTNQLPGGGSESQMDILCDQRVPEAPRQDAPVAVCYKRPRSDSAGLDALASLASKEKSRSVSPLASFLVSHATSSSDSDDSEGMPPPPPRRRRRSASNPEGMEKWDSLKQRSKLDTGRRHFVLPASILEEELQAISVVMQERERAGLSTGGTRVPLSIPEGDEVGFDDDDDDGDAQVDDDDDDDKEIDESELTPDELLRRARSRLLEDLSEGNFTGEKGVLTLPHSLDKYKALYNKNGRIGIYTPAERAAIIAKFNTKRTRRVWNKKIRYNCRKSLADRRLRVKGRFVKRSEQEQLAKELARKKAESGPTKKTDNENIKADDDMPDVNDPEAGFSLTEDQPYRRLRRNTIT